MVIEANRQFLSWKFGNICKAGVSLLRQDNSDCLNNCSLGKIKIQHPLGLFPSMLGYFHSCLATGSVSRSALSAASSFLISSTIFSSSSSSFAFSAPASFTSSSFLASRCSSISFPTDSGQMVQLMFIYAAADLFEKVASKYPDR